MTLIHEFLHWLSRDSAEYACFSNYCYFLILSLLLLFLLLLLLPLLLLLLLLPLLLLLFVYLLVHLLFSGAGGYATLNSLHLYTPDFKSTIKSDCIKWNIRLDVKVWLQLQIQSNCEIQDCVLFFLLASSPGNVHSDNLNFMLPVM